MQRMFAEGTDWQMTWMDNVLPNIVSITDAHPERTIFTPFHAGSKTRSGRWNVAVLLRAVGVNDHR